MGTEDFMHEKERAFHKFRCKPRTAIGVNKTSLNGIMIIKDITNVYQKFKKKRSIP